MYMYVVSLRRVSVAEVYIVHHVFYYVYDLTLTLQLALACLPWSTVEMYAAHRLIANYWRNVRGHCRDPNATEIPVHAVQL